MLSYLKSASLYAERTYFDWWHSNATRLPYISSLREVTGPEQVWDSQTLQCLRTLEGHEDNVRVLAVGDSYVFSGSWDKSIRFAAVTYNIALSYVHVRAYHSCVLSQGMAPCCGCIHLLQSCSHRQSPSWAGSGLRRRL